MGEFQHAVGKERLPPAAAPYVQTIRDVMEGSGTWEERAAALTDLDRTNITDAFLSLYDVLADADRQAVGHHP